MRAAVILIPGLLASLVWLDAPHVAHESPPVQQLPTIAPAPQFTLTSQDRRLVALTDLRGKVVAVTFIFTSCAATCPVLTSAMSTVQGRLGRDFGDKVSF